MHSQPVILSAIRHLQARRPDASVLVGDLQETLHQRGVRWQQGTIRTYLRQLADQQILEKLGRDVYRLTPTDQA